MAKKPSIASRRGLGGIAAVIGGLVMVGAVFLPWLRYPSLGNTMRGWDTFALSAGGERWATQHAFNAERFSPGFTGLVILIAGGLLGIVGLAMILSLRGGAFRIGRPAAWALRVLTLLILGIAATNLVSGYITSASTLVIPQWGLFQVSVGALIGLAAVWVGVSRRS